MTIPVQDPLAGIPHGPRPTLSRRTLLTSAGVAAAAAGPLSLLSSAPAHAAQPSFRTMATPRLQANAQPGSPVGPNYLGGLKLDSDGTPLTLLNGAWVSHPTVQGNFLNRHMQSFAVDQQRGHLTMVASCLDGIVGRAKRVGEAIMPIYNFEWHAHDGMPTGWVSSFGQSKFPAAAHRLYTATGDRKWLGLSEAFMAAFELPVSTTHPFVAGVDSSGYLWLDEYPNQQGLSRVFNGHIYAACELLFYAELSGNQRALQLVKGSVATAFAYRDQCRQPAKISRYYVGRTEALSTYQPIHHSCYLLLHKFTGVPQFGVTADQLRQDWAVDFRAGTLRILPNVRHLVRQGSVVKWWTPTTELQVASSRRGGVNNPTVWSWMDEGPHAGLQIQETTSAFRMGYDTDSFVFAPRAMGFGPGKHRAYAFSSNGNRVVRMSVEFTTRARANALRVAKMGGRWHWMMADGVFKGLWVEEGANNYFIV